MNNLRKRGSIELSFGMIFSIILIIGIVAVAVYAITAFLDIGDNTQLGLFHQKFQDSVDDIWASAITDKIVSFDLPKKIEAVCFGDLTGNSFNQRYEAEFTELKRYSSSFQQANTNLFLYPSASAGDLAYKKASKIDLSGLGSGFDCFEVKRGKVEIRMVKGNFDSSVRIEHP